MKKILLGLLVLVSFQAFGSTMDSSGESFRKDSNVIAGELKLEKNLNRFAGNYNPISNYCGIHVEVSGNILYLSYIGNTRLGKNCRSHGLTHKYTCDAKEMTCVAHLDDAEDEYLDLLEDGNIYRYGNVYEPLKYIKYKR